MPDNLNGLPVSGLGLRAVGSTVEFKFTTALNGIPTSLAGSPVVSVYKSGTTTPITAGVTLTTDYNSTVGLQDVTIVATLANGFTAGLDYEAVITTGTLGGVSMIGAVVGRFSLVTAPPYVGPGDIQSGAYAFWGLQAYSAAYAAPGNNPAIDLNNNSTGVLAGTVNFLPSGLLDTATAATLIAGGASLIGKWYDQTGNGRHQIQATNAHRATLSLTSGPGGNTPGAAFVSANNTSYSMSGAATIAQPFVAMAVANFNGGATGAQGILGSADSIVLGYRGSSNAFAFSCPNEGTVAKPQNSFHVAIGIGNGTSGELIVDGTSSGLLNFGSTTFTTALTLGIQVTGGLWDGFIPACGIWQGFDATTFPKASMNTNQHNNWGF